MKREKINHDLESKIDREQQASAPVATEKIHFLLNAAYAARAGAGHMTLSDWRDVEEEIKRRFEDER